MKAQSLTQAGNTLTTRLAAVPTNVVARGSMGAFVGGMAAAASNTYKVAKGEMSSVDAAVNVAQETMGTGLATAAGATVVTVLGLSGIFGLVGLVAVASLTRGAWDNAINNKKPLNGINVVLVNGTGANRPYSVPENILSLEL